MEKDLNKDQESRKRYIELFTDKLYTRFNYLFTDSIDVVKKKAMDKYMDSSMTIPEITEDMVKIIEEMKKSHDRQEQIKSEKHYDLNDLFDCRVSENCLHIHVVPKDVRADITNAGGPTKYINDVVAPKLDDALSKIADILNTEEKDVTVVAAISPTLRLAQQLFADRGFDVGETNNPKFIEMFNQDRIFKATIDRDKLLAIVKEKVEKESDNLEENTETKENEDEKISFGKEDIKSKMAGFAGTIGGVAVNDKAGFKYISENSTENTVANNHSNPTNELEEMIAPSNDKNDNLNAMLEDSNSSIEKSSENTINKQFIKTPPKPNINNDKQSGFVSIFNIVLALLGVTAFILAAMILNLLLK